MADVQLDQDQVLAKADELDAIAAFLGTATVVAPPPTIDVVALQSSWSEVLAPLAMFEIRLSHAVVSDITIHAETLAGTATSGTDFQPVDDDFVIPMGTTVLAIGVQIINDSVVENDEAFSLVISNASLGTINTDTAQVTIISEDIGTPPENPAVASGNVARIGVTGYASLAAAVAAVSSGGVIEILPGTHVGATKIACVPKRAMTIRGVVDANGVRPCLDLGATDTVSKGIINPESSTITIENLMLDHARTTGTTNDTKNGSGLRIEPSVLGLTVKNCIFKNCQNGVLSASTATSSIYNFEDSVFWKCGGSPSMSSTMLGKCKEAKFTRCSWSSGLGQHDLFTRALSLHLIDSTIEQNNVTVSAIENYNGGILYISGGRYFKPSNAVNDKLIRIAPGTRDGRPESYLIENATLDVQRSSSYVVYNYSPSLVVVRNCAIPSQKRTFGNVRIE